ncbi:hypothetical protein EV191_112128 [Tamaricihabitans halophyticus]|uniref:AB hydrolase-1 domain-containing protein n=1 Tax=Tamaricihabitans halophyticus TaxID=1262583 RepID=A0A4R2QE31_9PSEU|nr:alpha/beta fold hydrolase [Tamaricihabitans halophyticus]TCP47332.1 hypothetical protein EV191_112128 [Tamaricihabitans halophyticus]
MRFTTARRAAAMTAAALGVIAMMTVTGAASAQPAPAAKADSKAAAVSSGGGYNNWNCKPTKERPNPTIVMHGGGGNPHGHMGTLGASLAARGFCTFLPLYGEIVNDVPLGAWVDLESQADELTDYIDKVLAATGAEKVNLVGDSTGAFQSLYIPKVRGYADKVAKVVAISPPTRGLSESSLMKLANQLGITSAVKEILDGIGWENAVDLAYGAEAIEKLNDGPIAQPGVDYTIIASKTDEIVNPIETSFVRESGVDNIVTQDGCPINIDGHIAIVYNPRTWALVGNALDTNKQTIVPCIVGFPV